MKKDDPLAYADCENSHICNFCTYNYIGSAPGTELEGTRRIFNRSIEDHKLCYTEFLGDSDAKRYTNVKDTSDGIVVKKLECVGHYQKRIGTHCRKFKKTIKALGG